MRKSPEALAAIIIALLSIILSAYSGYQHNDKELSNRLTAVETQERNDVPRLDRIEGKLDRLVEWAYGDKR